MTLTRYPADPTGAHEAAGPPVRGDLDSFATHAQLARTLVDAGGVATLSTLTPTGHPYGSVAPYSVLDEGVPIICISTMAAHTRHLLHDPRSSLLVEQAAVGGVDQLSLPRATLIGSFVPFEPTPSDVDAYLGTHPHARSYVGYRDFTWWRLDVLEVRYVGGFGVMGWSSGDEYRVAVPDPVIPHAAPMIEHLNSDHSDACLDIVRVLGGVAEAATVSVSAIDRSGVTFDAFDEHGAQCATSRVAFAETLSAATEVRAATVALVRRAAATCA